MVKRFMNIKAIGLIVAVVVVLAVIYFVAVRPEPIIDPIVEEPVKEEPVQKDPPVQEEIPAEIKEFTQSPFLDGRDLPPVAERLPLEPKIVNEIPAEHMNFEIGRFGGTLRTVRMSDTWDAVLWCTLEEPLVNSPGRLMEEFTPNVVQSFGANDANTEFTFTLRKGMRWSDGHPLTTEDVAFSWNYRLKNEQLTPTWPMWLRTGHSPGGSPATLEIVDDYTFKIIFDGPYGGFIPTLAVGGYHALIHPAHHMKQFHIDFADEAELAALVEEYGYEPGEWFNLYLFMEPSPWYSGRSSQMTTPTLGAFVMARHEEPRIFERNPFYFKVDPIGQQLPYIDRIVSTFVMDLEAASVKLLAGDVDFAYEWISLDKTALFKENEERGGFRLITGNVLHRTAADVFINLTYPDETWREIVRDIRFRQALNLAIDKEDLVEAVYLGFAKPSPMQGIEQDVERANQLLDEMGMVRGADGYRTTPDGEAFAMDFTFAAWMIQWPPTAELIAEYWREIGLRVNLRTVDNTLRDSMVAANEIQVTTAFSHGPVFAMWDDWGFNAWGRLWRQWFETDGELGEEPPAEVLEFYELVNSIRTEPPERISEIREELNRSMGEHLHYLIPVEDVIQVTFVNANMRNYPDVGLFLANAFSGEQWWLDE